MSRYNLDLHIYIGNIGLYFYIGLHVSTLPRCNTCIGNLDYSPNIGVLPPGHFSSWLFPPPGNSHHGHFLPPKLSLFWVFFLVVIVNMVTGILPPGKFPPEGSTIPVVSHPNIPPPTKPGFAKYAVDANLFPLESSILTRVKRATNQNNVATEKRS